MDLLPAIDLRRGAAVRLTQGDFERTQEYGDPLALAARYVEGGARWIHVVDLEAARTGVLHERATVAEIVRLAARASVRVQLGGGLRSEEAVAEQLALGVARVVLGTVALEDPDLAARCARRWPGQVAVGLDYRLGKDGTAEPMGHGWQAGSGLVAGDLLSRWQKEPIAAVVATAVARDGMLDGPDVAGIAGLLGATALPVVASGGVAATGDLTGLGRLTKAGHRVAGVIVGKALVEGRFSVEEGLAACAASA